MSKKICNVGACFTDLIAYAPRMPGPGETLVGTKFASGFGGKGANQAVQAAKLGAQVMMISKLGDDTFGADTIKNFESQGVDATFVTQVKGMSSGVAPITVDERTGQNCIIIVPGALEKLAPADVEAAREAIKGCGLMMVQLEAPMEATLAALTIAREEGVMTLLNTAPARKLPDDIWPLCDIVCPNEPELQMLTDLPTSTDAEVTAAAEVLMQRGAKKVVVTIGERGAAVFERGAEPKFVPTTAVTARDTTGAGDSFLGALAANLVAGKDLEAAMAEANLVASVSVTREGTQKSLPTAAEMQSRKAGGGEKKEKAGKKGKEKAAKDAAPAAVDPAKKLKNVIKEGGKRGVEIEGAADMGGLQFFSTSVDEPDGDLDLLVESMKAMNNQPIPGDEERKGCSGHIGKMIFSAGIDQLAVVAYVPEEKLGELSCEEWLKAVLANFGGEVVSSSDAMCVGRVIADGNKNIFPLKIREPMILESNNFLRKKGLFPEDKDSDDDMVFGDDDFPS